MAAEIIGTIESPKGNIFNIKWDSDSGKVFVGKDDFFCLGKAYSDDQAIAKVYGMVRNFAKGRTRNIDNEIPKPLMDCLEEFRELIQSRMKEDPLDIIANNILRKGSSIPDSKAGGYTITNKPGNFSEVRIPPEFYLTLEELEEESSTPISIDVALAAEKILELNNKEKEEFKTTKNLKNKKEIKMAAEFIGEVVSPKGKIFKVKWDSDSKEIFMAIENDWSKLGEAKSADEAMKRAEGMVKHLALGRYPIFDDRPTPLSWIERPKGFGKFTDLEETTDELPSVPIDTVLAIQEILGKNKIAPEKQSLNEDSSKKKNTAEVHYSEGFISQGLKVLREMVEKNLTQMPYGEPFNFSVVIGETDKLIIAVLNVPDELKSKFGDKAYIVQE